MSPCSRKAREYGLKLLFLKTEVEKSGYTISAAVCERRTHEFIRIEIEGGRKSRRREKVFSGPGPKNSADSCKGFQGLLLP